MKPVPLLLPAAAVLIFLFGGCSEEPPRIIQVFHQVHVVKDLRMEDIYSQLSLFVHVEDEDGIEDIESIYLIQDEEELFWKLDEQNWESYEEQGESWIGTNRIIMNDYSPLPWGDYRLIIVDAAGERDRREIYLPKPEYKPDEIVFPEITVDEERVRVSGGPEQAQYTFWVVREDGRLLNSVKTTESSLSIATLKGSAEGGSNPARSFYVYTYDAQRGFGKIVGPVYY